MNIEKIEESVSTPNDYALDPSVLQSLHEKYKDYFDNHNKMMEKEYGEYFNAYITPETELLPYFKDLELRDDLLQDKAILDIGSSNSFFDDYCKQKYNSTAVAIDIEPDSLGEKHDLAVVTDARNLPFKNDSFDLIISHASMPHILVPHTDEDWNFVTLEGEVRQEAINDVLSVLREAYRVTKKGGQIRMSTFSEKQETIQANDGAYSGIEATPREGESISVNGNKSLDQQLSRIKLIKEVLSIFEKESGARCIFKDEEKGGLIIIFKD